MSGDPAPDSPYPDGEYPAIVIDAEEGVADDGSPLTHVELALLTGPRKGSMVAVTATGNLGSAIDLLGMPATLTVSDGQPSFTIDT